MNCYKALKILLMSSGMLCSCTGDFLTETSAISTCKFEGKKLSSNYTWTQADILSVEVENNQFTPSLIELEKDKPYILSLSNKDENTQWFNADDFLKNSTIKKIIIDGAEIDESCPASVAVPPNKNSNIYLIPRNSGNYTFSHQNLFLELFSGGPVNLIFVTAIR